MILGFIHVCQEGDWRRSWNLLLESLKTSGLYKATSVIFVGVVNFTEYDFCDLEKVIFIDCGPASFYERPTLTFLRQTVEDQDKVWYMHTKGIRHWGMPAEPFVLDWIAALLYWNVEQWKLAEQKLDRYDAYGCLFKEEPQPHFSGNFWWAKGSYIKTLPMKIGRHYCDPEMWVLSNTKKYFSAFNSTVNNYFEPLPRNAYCIPSNTLKPAAGVQGG